MRKLFLVAVIVLGTFSFACANDFKAFFNDMNGKTKKNVKVPAKNIQIQQAQPEQENNEQANEGAVDTGIEIAIVDDRKNHDIPYLNNFKYTLAGIGFGSGINATVYQGAIQATNKLRFRAREECQRIAGMKGGTYVNIVIDNIKVEIVSTTNVNTKVLAYGNVHCYHNGSQ